MRALVKCWLVVVLSLSAAFAEAQRLPSRLVTSKTRAATCYKPGARGPFSDLVGSQVVRTPVFTSPDGRYRAYVEEEADAFKIPKNDVHRWSAVECANTTRLFVAGPGQGPFRLVFLQVPDFSHILNSIALIDWSPDSRQLIFELNWSTYDTDFFPNCLLLYDPAYGYFKECGFAEAAFSAKVNKECSVLVEPLGFFPDGKVVLTAQPYYDVDGEMAEPACVNKKGTWLLDPHGGNLSPLPDDYKVQRYGWFEEEKTKSPSP